MNKTDLIVSHNLETVFRNLLKELESLTGEVPAVSLCIFNQQSGGYANYISNCEREAVAKIWNELIIQWEENVPQVSIHKLN